MKSLKNFLFFSGYQSPSLHSPQQAWISSSSATHMLSDTSSPFSGLHFTMPTDARTASSGVKADSSFF